MHLKENKLISPYYDEKNECKLTLDNWLFMFSGVSDDLSKSARNIIIMVYLSLDSFDD